MKHISETTFNLRQNCWILTAFIDSLCAISWAWEQYWKNANPKFVFFLKVVWLMGKYIPLTGIEGYWQYWQYHVWTEWSKPFHQKQRQHSSRTVPSRLVKKYFTTFINFKRFWCKMESRYLTWSNTWKNVQQKVWQEPSGLLFYLLVLPTAQSLH